jgi:hypothetical protein
MQRPPHEAAEDAGCDMMLLAQLKITPQQLLNHDMAELMMVAKQAGVPNVEDQEVELRRSWEALRTLCAENSNIALSSIKEVLSTYPQIIVGSNHN